MQAGALRTNALRSPSFPASSSSDDDDAAGRHYHQPRAAAAAPRLSSNDPARQHHRQLQHLPEEGFVIVGPPPAEGAPPGVPTTHSNAPRAFNQPIITGVNHLPRWIPRDGGGTADGEEETVVAAGQGMRGAATSSMLQPLRQKEEDETDEAIGGTNAAAWLQRDCFALTYTSPGTEREFLYRLYEWRTQGLLSLFGISTFCGAVLIVAYETSHNLSLQRQLIANSAISALFGCCLFVWKRVSKAANIQSVAAAEAGGTTLHHHTHHDHCNPLVNNAGTPAGALRPEKDGCSGRALFPTSAITTTTGAASLAATRRNQSAISFILNQERDLKHRFVRVFEFFCIVLGCLFASFCNAQLGEMAACESALTDTSGYRSMNPCTAFVPTVGTVCQMSLVFILAPRAIITIPLMLLCTMLIYLAHLQLDHELYTAASFALVATVLSCISVYLLLMAVLQDRAARVVFEDSIRLDMAVHHTLQVRRELDEILEAIFPQKLVLERIIARKTVVDNGDAVAVSMFEVRDFLKWSTTMLPADTINTIGFLYGMYDRAAGELGIEFVKALGDRYLASSGLHTGNSAEESLPKRSKSTVSTLSTRHSNAPAAWDSNSSVARMCRFALRQQQIIDDVNRRVQNVLEPLAAVVAVHVGPALGVMLGSKHVMSYELIGPAVVVVRQLVSVVPERDVTASIDAVQALLLDATTSSSALPGPFSLGTSTITKGIFSITPASSPVELLSNGCCVRQLAVATIRPAATNSACDDRTVSREAYTAADEADDETLDFRYDCDLQLQHPIHSHHHHHHHHHHPDTSHTSPSLEHARHTPDPTPSPPMTTYNATVDYADRVQRLRYLAMVAMVRSRHYQHVPGAVKEAGPERTSAEAFSSNINNNNTNGNSNPFGALSVRPSFSLTLSKRTPLVPPELLGLSSDMFTSGSMALFTSGDNNNNNNNIDRQQQHAETHPLLGCVVRSPPAAIADAGVRHSRAAVELARALAAVGPKSNVSSPSDTTGVGEQPIRGDQTWSPSPVDPSTHASPVVDNATPVAPDDAFGRDAFDLFLRQLRPDVAAALERDANHVRGNGGRGLQNYMALVGIMRRGTVDSSSGDSVIVTHIRTLFRTLIRRVFVPYESATIAAAFQQFHFLRGKQSKRTAFIVHACFMKVVLVVVIIDLLVVSKRLPDNSLAPLTATQRDVLLSAGFFLIVIAIVLSWVRVAIGAIPCRCSAADAAAPQVPDVDACTQRIVRDIVVSPYSSSGRLRGRHADAGAGAVAAGGETASRCVGSALCYNADVVLLLSIFALGHVGMTMMPRGVINNSHVFLFQHHVVMAFLVTTCYTRMIAAVFVDAAVFLLTHLLIQTDDGKGRWMLVYFYVFAAILMAWVRELRFIYRFDLLCLHRALLDATREELSLQRHLFSVLLPPCLRDRDTIAQLAAHRRALNEHGLGGNIPLLPPIRLHHSDICTLAIRIDPFLFSGAIPPALFVLRLDAILSAIECAVYEANEMVCGIAHRKSPKPTSKRAGSITSSASSTSASSDFDEEWQFDETSDYQDHKRHASGGPTWGNGSSNQVALSRISLSGDYILFAGPLLVAKHNNKNATANAAAAAQPPRKAPLSNAVSDIALAKAAKAVLMVCSSMLQAAEADRTDVVSGGNGSEMRSVHAATSPGPYQYPPAAGQRRPTAALQLTSVACLGSGFVTILGSRGLMPTLLGAVARQSTALLHAAPTGFHGCSEQFFNFLSHAGVDTEDHGGASVAFLSELKWRVRGSGTMMVRPFGLAPRRQHHAASHELRQLATFSPVVSNVQQTPPCL